MNVEFQLPVKPLIHTPAMPTLPNRVAHRHSQDWRAISGLGSGQMSTAEYYARLYKVPPFHNSGMGRLGANITGSAATADQIASTGAATTVSLLVAFGAVGGPLGAAIGGLIAVGSAIASMFGGCGQTCIQATNITNQLTPVLLQNLQEYLAAPIHYKSLQAAALNNFQTGWNAIVQACSNPSLGTAGQHCISDRQQGACTIHSSTPGGWQQQGSGWTYVYPGPAASSGTCWNYFVGFHDPIANDPTVVSDPSSTTGSGSTGTSGGTIGAGLNMSELLPVLMIGGGALLAVYLLN